MLDKVLDSSVVSEGNDTPEGYVELLSRRFYRIDDYDLMAPFFMTIVGAGDAWLFVSSTGGLTAGRVAPDSALFPYYTDDKVAESAGRTGGLSLLRVTGMEHGTVLWEPFTSVPQVTDGVRRVLYKDVAGTALVFEETRDDLGLRMRVTWQTGGRFGIVRTSELTNVGDRSCEVELLDGFVNVLPAGVDVDTQNRLSNLLDAYKRSESDPRTGLGMFWLSSRLTDLAEPSESLYANVAWHVGLGDVDHLVSTQQLPTFRRGGPVVAERDVRGQRGAYLVHDRVSLAPGEQRTWSVVGDVDQDAAKVVELRDLLTGPDDLAALLEEDVRANRVELDRILASSDGLQSTGEELATAHHTANVLFNVMRGGIPAKGYLIEASDVLAFIEDRSPATAERCAALLARHARADDDRPAARGGPGQPGSRPAPDGPGVPAADVQPSPWGSVASVEQVPDRAARRERRSAAELPGQLARHLPELGGPRVVVPGVPGVDGRGVPRCHDC